MCLRRMVGGTRIISNKHMPLSLWLGGSCLIWQLCLKKGSTPCSTTKPTSPTSSPNSLKPRRNSSSAVSTSDSTQTTGKSRTSTRLLRCTSSASRWTSRACRASEPYNRTGSHAPIEGPWLLCDHGSRQAASRSQQTFQKGANHGYNHP